MSLLDYILDTGWREKNDQKYCLTVTPFGTLKTFYAFGGSLDEVHLIKYILQHSLELLLVD